MKIGFGLSLPSGNPPKGPPGGEPPPPTDSVTYPDALLFEDGEAITTEDGDVLILES